MNPLKLLRFAPLLLILASCATTSTVEPDGMCRELAAFANASIDKTIHTVELTTEWTGFRPIPGSDKLAVASKECKDGGYGAGTTFCKWLVEHTSSEFAEINISRALSCMGNAKVYAGAPHTSIEYLAGKIASYETKYVHEDVRVTIEYSVRMKDKLPMLRISAERFSEQ